MSYQMLTSWFGWMTAINLGLLVVIAILVIFCRPMMIKVHRSLFRLSDEDLTNIYFTWLGNFKLLTIFFCLVPYLSLRLIGG